jgi:RecA-family ATPase
MNIEVEWIIERHIPKGSITLVFGKGGIGKTWLLLDMARCIGSGTPFLGYETNKAPVIFIDFENPLAVLNTRTQTLGDAEDVHFWRVNNDKMKAPKLDSKEWKQYKCLPEGAVLIFDTLRASQSKDENASNEMGLIMNRLKELRDSGFTIILLHHTAKNSDNVAKGSTAIVDLADHILGLTRVKKKKDGQEIVVDEDDEDAIYRFGVSEKTRYEPHHVYLALNPDKGFELAPDPQEGTLKDMHKVLTEHGTMNMTSFIENCQDNLSVAKKKLRKLIDVGNGRYWDIENRRDEKNAKFVIPKSDFQFSNPI